jgi:Protein of unknown function (DUF3723)
MASKDFGEFREVGIARVDISCLAFIERRQIDRRIVDYLKGIFEATKCGQGSEKDSRYDAKNYVPVYLKSSSELKRVLNASKKTHKDLNVEGGPPCFLQTAPGQKLLGVDGRHRIQAAKEHLRPGNRWWIVRLLLKAEKGTLCQLPLVCILISVGRWPSTSN